MPEDKILKQATPGLNNTSSFDRPDMHKNRNIAAQKAPRESRISQRHAISASAEIVEPRSRTRLTCRATDLSAGGCYLDTLNPFDAGTALHLQLVSENRVFQTEARVLYANPGLGMGLAFTKMPPESQEILSEWVRVLAHEIPEPEPAGEPVFDFVEPAKSAAPREGVREILGGLVTLLVQKKILTDSEVEEMRQKLSRGGD